jgi:hypothetical protein
LSRNSGASTSRNPKGLSRLVAGKLFFLMVVVVVVVVVVVTTIIIVVSSIGVTKFITLI